MCVLCYSYVVYNCTIPLKRTPMSRIPTSEARMQVAELVNKVAFGGERITLHRHGKDVAAIVPVEDLHLLEALENKMDLDAARAALKEKAPRVAWKHLKSAPTP